MPIQRDCKYKYNLITHTNKQNCQHKYKNRNIFFKYEMHWQRASQWREKNAGTVGFANVIDWKYATRSSHAFMPAT